ncbi:hypothetical protein K474DRAFT_1681918 [Panus rudis PR-1116 ss-1]|nr:hypothetical protein K474DRAFT_1681918 [Panus rudis PR-1116 ss-1]
MSTQTYGKCLPDQVDRIASLTDAQLELLDDVRELFRERIALEREYATKLQILGKKAAEKKNRKIAALVVGTEPTKAWTEATLQGSTLNHAYSQLISSVLDSAQDHVNVSDALNVEVVEALKATQKRHEEAKKKQMQYFQKLLSDRDRAYSDRLKYDDECTEVESYRQKQERSSDDRHAERAAKQLEQQQIDMMNSKNVYIISTAIANKAKARFYGDDLPGLEDQFQNLQSQLLTRLATIVAHGQSLQSKHLDTLKSRVIATEEAFKSIDPAHDQDIFIDHNIRPFKAPPDWDFEPCSIHYDNGSMSVDPAPKVYLQNRLTRCKQKLLELHPMVDAKRKEVEQLARLITAYGNDSKLGNVEEVTDLYLDAQHQLAAYESTEDALRAEVEVISDALDGDEGSQNLHAFHSSTFSIPTQCAYCQSTIWGLSKQGKKCKACGIAVHTKCEMKVAADCPGSRNAGAKGHASSGSISHTSAPVSRSSSVGSINESSLHAVEEATPSARVLFDFTATSPFELTHSNCLPPLTSIIEGETVQVLEEDDGSGWVKVESKMKGKGLVPASYVELIDDHESHVHEANVPAHGASATQGSGKYVRGLYDYRAQGSDELSIKEGELIELTGGPSGGQNYADGWWEGIDSKGKKGIFPSNYVR